LLVAPTGVRKECTMAKKAAKKKAAKKVAKKKKK
jgi:hypothetical protein